MKNGRARVIQVQEVIDQTPIDEYGPAADINIRQERQRTAANRKRLGAESSIRASAAPKGHAIRRRFPSLTHKLCFHFSRMDITQSKYNHGS